MTDVEVPPALAHALGTIGRNPPTGAPLPHQLSRLAELDHVVMLVGPGVVAAGAVEGLRSFAEAANLGVANTYGAKGVLRWDSPHHLGTCGLQRDDAELLGLGSADLVITSGLDPDESDPQQYLLTQSVDIAPEDLETFASHTGRAPNPIAETELYRRIAAIAVPGYTDDREPRHPAAAVAGLRSAFPGATVIAEPGLAGLWVARTYPTEELGSVVVPCRGAPGIAVALGRVTAGGGVPTVVVTTKATPQHSFPVVVWDDVDWSPTDELVAAAGPIVGINGARLSP